MALFGYISKHFDAMHHCLSGRADAPADSPYIGSVLAQSGTVAAHTDWFQPQQARHRGQFLQESEEDFEWRLGHCRAGDRLA